MPRSCKLALELAFAVMPRDMTGTGRYAPQPRFPPFAFYSAVRLADPGQLALIMATDPYFVTQDNGAGAPLHFATTYRQLDMVRLQLAYPAPRRGAYVVSCAIPTAASKTRHPSAALRCRCTTY